MTSEPAYFHLFSNTMNPCFPTAGYHAEAKRTWLCPSCFTPRPGVESVDAWLQDRAPRDKPLNLVYGCGLGLIHRELLSLVGDELVQRDLYLGRVIGGRGEEIKDWVTFRGRRRVVVRGDKEAGYRLCEDCGRHVYYAAGRQYLHPAPPVDATIFESDVYGLVVPPEIYERIGVRKWRRLAIDKLPILAEPLDGLGVIPFE
jgi:hypothetical protein